MSLQDALVEQLKKDGWLVIPPATAAVILESVNELKRQLDELGTTTKLGTTPKEDLPFLRIQNPSGRLGNEAPVIHPRDRGNLDEFGERLQKFHDRLEAVAKACGFDMETASYIQKKILAVLAEEPRRHRDDVAKLVGRSGVSVAQTLRRLIDEGMVVRVSRGSYALNEEVRKRD